MLSGPILLSAQDENIGDISDGSRTTPVHVIKLIDQDSSVIWLDESPLMPFSTKKTCEACHNYQIISTGTVDLCGSLFCHTNTSVIKRLARNI
jgi:hypothetical protein